MIEYEGRQYSENNYEVWPKGRPGDIVMITRSHMWAVEHLHAHTLQDGEPRRLRDLNTDEIVECFKQRAIF